MKKILMLVTMIMMLAVSAVCSASNGKVLDEEEVIVDKFINGGNYKAVTSMMTEDMQRTGMKRLTIICMHSLLRISVS